MGGEWGCVQPGLSYLMTLVEINVCLVLKHQIHHGRVFGMNE